MNSVELVNVKFFYSKQLVLNDINAKIPFGKIYSLLGPSGAGKTTLLRLILGRIKPSSGHIEVFGGKPGTQNRLIGYMPQDSGLNLTFTVGQTFQYFANIYRLSPKQFSAKKEYLRKILGLPEDGAKISELSGGQQKMISLSITFFNNPKLMILDEPTVGSDPTLGDCIWKHLHKLCLEQNISIVVVTHYIEEAGRAHTVGIMRQGKMVEEGPADHLIEKYQKRTLEEVFLYLFENDAETKPSEPPMTIIEPTITNTFHSLADHQEPVKNGFLVNSYLNLWILLVLIRRNLSRFFHLNASLFVFLLPAIQAVILGLVFGVDSVGVSTGVYIAEPDPVYSTRLLDSFKKVDLYYLNPVRYESLDAALEALDRAKVIGVLEFDKSFSEALLTRIIEPDTIDNETLRKSNIKLYVDGTNFLYFNGFLDSLRQTVYDLLNNLYSEQNVTQLGMPLEIQEVIYAKDSKLSDYLLPAYLIFFMYLSQVSISSQMLIQEKKDGLFERSLVSGVKHSLVFLSHLISNIILSIIQIFLMLVVAFIIFNFTNYGPIWLISLCLFLQAITAVSTGLFISAIFKEGFTAILFTIFLTFSQIFSSGSFFPKEFVHPRLQPYIYLFPIAIPNESLRNVILRGWPLTHPNVYNGLILNIIATIGLSVVSAIIFKRNS